MFLSCVLILIFIFFIFYPSQQLVDSSIDIALRWYFRIILLIYLNLMGLNIKNLAFSSYFIQWYEFSPKLRRALQMIMIRASRSCVIHAGPTIEMKMETYYEVCIILKSIISSF